MPPRPGALAVTHPPTPGTPRAPLDRRAFVEQLSRLGVGSTLLPGVLWAKLQTGAEITPATVAAAEEVAGVRFDDAERAMIVERLNGQAEQIAALHAVPLDNAVPPAVVFDPRPVVPALAG